jgi:hypothetical protein
MILTSCCDSRFGLSGDIEPHEALDLGDLAGKVNQCLVNSANQILKVGEVLVVRGTPLHLFPQKLDRVVVRRVGRQLKDREPILMRGKERTGRLAGVILGSILNEDQMLRRLGQRLGQKRLIPLRVEALLLTMIEKPSRDQLDQTQHLVSFALAGRLDDGRFPLECPGIAQRAPLRKADLISEQDQRLLLLSQTLNLRPGGCPPLAAGLFVQMVRHKAGFLNRETRLCSNSQT